MYVASFKLKGLNFHLKRVHSQSNTMNYSICGEFEDTNIWNNPIKPLPKGYISICLQQMEAGLIKT